MLNNAAPSDKSKIVDVRISVSNIFIDLEIKEGSIVDSIFIPDGRSSKTVRIKNILNTDINKIDVDLVVDVNNQVTLSQTPVNGNPVLIDNVEVVYAGNVTGNLVYCSDKIEGETATVSYYYTKTGRNWFNEAVAFISDEHVEYAGLNDYDYLSKRLWTIAIDMGLVQGTLV